MINRSVCNAAPIRARRERLVFHNKKTEVHRFKNTSVLIIRVANAMTCLIKKENTRYKKIQRETSLFFYACFIYSRSKCIWKPTFKNMARFSKF